MAGPKVPVRPRLIRWVRLADLSALCTRAGLFHSGIQEGLIPHVTEGTRAMRHRGVANLMSPTTVRPVGCPGADADIAALPASARRIHGPEPLRPITSRRLAALKAEVRHRLEEEMRR